MNCKEWQEQLPAYMEDELEAKLKAALAEHLSECDSCRKELQLWHQAMALVHQLPQVEPSSALRERLLTAVKEEAETKRHYSFIEYYNRDGNSLTLVREERGQPLRSPQLSTKKIKAEVISSLRVVSNVVSNQWTYVMETTYLVGL